MPRRRAPKKTSLTRTLSKRTPEGGTTPVTDVEETWSEGFTTRKRKRTLWSTDAKLSAADLADPYGEASSSASMRDTPAPRRRAAVPYYAGGDGAPVHTSELPEWRWEFQLAQDTKHDGLRALTWNAWLPMVWDHYRAAGLPTGHMVFLQDPASGDFVPETASPASEDFAACPAWRLPAAFRLEENEPASLAGNLLFIACALLESIDPAAPRLRARFADDADDLEPLGTAVLAARGAELFAALQFLSPWPEHPTGKSIFDAAHAGAHHDRVTLTSRLAKGWERITPKLNAAYAAGDIGSRNDYARIVMEETGEPDLGNAKSRVELYERLNLITPVKGRPGRRSRAGSRRRN